MFGHPKYLTPLLIQTLNAALYTVNVTLWKAVYQHMRTSPAATADVCRCAASSTSIHAVCHELQIQQVVDLLSRFFKHDCNEQLCILRVD